MTTRILIADDHDVVRSGLRTVLEGQPNWEVVAEAADGNEAIFKAIETRPDIAVVDYSLPLINGIGVTRQIRARLPKTEILIFTMLDDETIMEELVRAGARGYLLKSDAARELISAIESLRVHRPYFTTKASEALLKSHLSSSERTGPTLTEQRAQLGPTSCRRTHEQGRRSPSRYKHQDGGDTPRDRHAQAQSHIVCRLGALRDPQQPRGGMMLRREERAQPRTG